MRVTPAARAAEMTESTLVGRMSEKRHLAPWRQQQLAWPRSLEQFFMVLIMAQCCQPSGLSELLMTRGSSILGISARLRRMLSSGEALRQRSAAPKPLTTRYGKPAPFPVSTQMCLPAALGLEHLLDVQVRFNR